jgi:hypothetical protein
MMNRTATMVKRMTVWAAVAATLAVSPVWAKGNRNAETNAATITLQVYNYAKVNRTTLAAAEKEAARILAEAGVTASWLECPTSHEAAKDFPACTLTSSGDYIVSVLPNAMADKLRKSSDTFGAAIGADSGLPRANIFYERISDKVGGDTAAVDVLAGRVMAREIGSLLLGVNANSSTGIMKAFWTTDDLSMLARNQMVFTAKQARQMDTRLAQEAQTRQAHQAHAQDQVAKNDPQ